MQLLLNYHLAAFLVVCDFKKWPNDNLITVACVFALVLLYSYSLIQREWVILHSLGRNLISVLVLTSCLTD